MRRDLSPDLSRRVPRLALWLLERRVPVHEREFFIGDLLERLAAMPDDASARRRCWREAIAGSFRRNRDHLAVPFQRGLMTDLGFDLNLAVRRLRRTPGFTLAASLTLALGVGAACAMVAVVRPALWGALPFRDAQRIVSIREQFSDGSTGRMGYLTIKDLRANVQTMEAVTAVSNWMPTLSNDDATEQLSGSSVTTGWFTVMGVRPALGREFLPEEDAPGAARVAILSHGIWQRRFGGDTSLIGRTIRLSGIEHQVVGVLPASHESILGQGAEILRPLRYADTSGPACRSCRHLEALGRVRSGVPMEVAASDVAKEFARIRETYPQDYAKNTAVATVLRDRLTEGMRGPLLALLGAAVLLLLISLANDTNLFVARAIQRTSEVVVRTALGASRWRLTRGMLLESLLVAALGAFFGLALAQGAIGTLLALAPASLPRQDQVRMDGGVAILAAGLAIALGVVSGTVPVLALTGRRRDRLVATTRTVARGGKDVVRRGLVVLEMSLALLLLAGAGILVQSVRRLLAVETGFATGNRVTMRLLVSGPKYNDDAQVFQAWRAVHEGVTAIPGVASASLTSQLPMSDDYDTWGLHWESAPRPNPSEDGEGFRFAVTHDYAKTMGITVRRGRFIEATDNSASDLVVVINEHVAKREFGAGNPIGQRLKMGGMDGPWRTVVGVVSDVRHRGLDAPMMGQVYLPLDQNSYADGLVRLIVQSPLDITQLTNAVRQVVRRVDPSIVIADVVSLPELLDRSAAQRRFAERLFQAFALAALVLAAVGTFGVMAGMAGERTREIGVRAALGANRSQILGLFLRQGVGLAGIGVAVGLAGAMVLGQALRPLVFGISPRDPVTLAAVSSGLGLVALLATMWPAWRATRVDAASVLRSE